MQLTKLRLQWSRRYSRRIINASGGDAASIAQASMEPPLFTADNVCDFERNPLPYMRFNGAAVIHGG